MTDDKWKNYQNYIDNEINTTRIRSFLWDSTDRQYNLNKFWQLIKEITIKAAKKYIISRKSCIREKIHPNNNNSKIYKDINSMNKIFHNFRKNNFGLSHHIAKDKWLNWYHHVKDVCIKYKIPFTLSYNITSRNKLDIKKTLHSIIQTLICKSKIEDLQIKRDNIKKFVVQRCMDYKNNEKQMINSILDINRKRIVLDRVLIENQDNSTYLLTDPLEIKQAAIDHFQHAAGAINQTKTIPSEWIDEYNPRSYIDDYIYDNLMNDIEADELISLISTLPNNKASGPSTISNEMIKHFPDSMVTLIRILFNKILLYNDIPIEWKSATIYPIPKPKEWECKLQNTRPITLLETMRKLFTKVLNKRLSTIYTTHCVLKGNNFAGLPHNSTFEPLRILDNIIQDARYHKNELWILL